MMPELPEVESVRRGLVRARLRAPLTGLWRSSKPLRVGKHWRDENLKLLRGCTPGTIRRRGKYIVWQFDSPRGEQRGLIIHLGMSGRCGLARTGDARVEHTHLVLTFADGREVRFVDPRRFGGLRAGTLADLQRTPPVSELGPEPLSRRMSGAHLEERAGNSARVLRDVLLDQRVIAGVGNIYAVEALFEARLHPLLRARRLRRPAWDRLAAAVVTVLRRGIKNGGTTFKDFRNVTGEVGGNWEDLRVYGRARAPCPRCGAVLIGFAHSARSGVLCPVCQRRPRTRLVS